MEPIIIIGAGLAGYNLAKEIRKLDSKLPILVITKDDGYFYSKPMISTALTNNKSPEDLYICDAEKMRTELNLEIKTNSEITEIDPKGKTVTVAKDKIKYSKLVLAWGARVKDIKLEGNGKDDAYRINHIDDYKKFRDNLIIKHKAYKAKRADKPKVIIVGSGLIGCELANDLSNIDCNVEIISKDKTPLSKYIPKEVGEALALGFSHKKIIWHFETKIQSVNRHPDGGLFIKLEGKSRIIPADFLLIAIGITPIVDLAVKAGLAVNKGIKVNEYLQTSNANIYAIGDCAEVLGHSLQFVSPLLNCARTLAKTLTKNKTKISYPSMPVSVRTPACPVILSYPNSKIEGNWEVESAGTHVKAVCFGKKGEVLGYALSDERVSEKHGLSVLLPPLIPDN